ncbi:MAG: carboxypeptidase regulatory-like domain-containing protein [Sumerlaeia bacterium]
MADGTGEAVAGARVELIEYGLRSMAIGQEIRVLASAETDAQGRFSIPDTGPEDETRAIRASAPGFASRIALRRFAPPALQDFTALENVEIRLQEAAAAISGRVADADGRAIADARVTVTEQGSSPHGQTEDVWTMTMVQVQTSADGSFQVEGLPANQEFAVNAKAKGYGPVTKREVKSGESGLLLTLEAATASLTVKVISETGEPVADALVAVYRRSEESGFNSVFIGKADAEGIADVGAVVAGEFFASASIEGEGDGSKQVTLADGEHRDVTLTLPSPVMIRGRVVMEETNEGVPGVVLASQSLRSPRASARTTTGPDGQFELKVVPNVSLGADGEESHRYAPLYFETPPGLVCSYASDHGNGPMVTIGGDNLEKEAVIRLSAGQEVRGVVVNSEGTPVGMASVEVYFVANGGSLGGPSNNKRARTANDGTFSITLPLRSQALFLAAAEFEGAAQSGLLSEEALNKPVRLELKKFAAVSGRISGGHGEPLEEIRVTASRTIRLPLMHYSNQINSVKTDGGGYYFLENLPSGDLEIKVDAPGDLADPAPVELTLEPGDLRENVDFKIVAGDVLEVVVLDRATKEPIEGVRLHWQTNGNSSWNPSDQKTDAEGRYTITGLPPDGTIQWMSLNRNGYAYENVRSASMYDSPLTIFMDKLGRATLLAKKEDGTPVRAFRYQLIHNPDSEHQFTGQSGRSDPGAGEADVSEHVQTAAVRFIVEELDEQTGEPTGLKGSKAYIRDTPTDDVTIEAVLSGGLPMIGKVVRYESGKQPVAQATVRMVQPRNNSQMGRQAPALKDPVTTDATGTFRFEDVLPGTYFLVAKAPDGEESPPTAATLSEEDPAKEVEVLIGGSVVVFGTVTDEHGDPIEGARVEAENHNRDGMPIGQNDSTDAEGKYRIEGLREGWTMVTMSVPDSNYPEQNQNFNAEVGEERELNFDVGRTVHVTGRLTLNGEPPRGFQWRFDPAGEDTENDAVLTLNPDGTYETHAEPGRYTLWRETNSNSLIGNFPQGVVYVEDTPDVQQIDIDLHTSPLDVVVITPPGKSWADIQSEHDPVMSVEQRYSTGDWGTVIWEASAGESRRLLDVPSGEYRLSLRAGDGNGEPLARSEPVPVGPEEENIAVLEFLDAEPRTYTLTVTLPPGDYEYKFWLEETDSWFSDPLNPESNPEANDNSIVHVPGGAKDPETGRRADSPQVNDATGEVTFLFSAPASTARTAYLRNSSNNWAPAPEFQMTPVESPGGQ